jgi:large subunit ribosomal protein L17
MRHRKEGKKFHRKTGQRRAFIRGLAMNLIRQGRITTTETRAKALRPVVEKLVTIARRNDLASRRLIASRLASPTAARRLVEDIAPRYQGRPGGYTRILKLATLRKRDGTHPAVIEFV